MEKLENERSIEKDREYIKELIQEILVRYRVSESSQRLISRGITLLETMAKVESAEEVFKEATSTIRSSLSGTRL